MTRIAIVGANGQVGTEVCLFLRAYSGVEPIAVVRTELGTALLRRLGVECRVGSISDASRASQLLEGVSVVADFSLPGGLPSEARAGMRRNIWQALRHAPRGARYVFISSTMAFGMTIGSHPYSAKALSRTLYARQKRHGERFAAASGAILGRPVFNLRLGEVHGELQAVSRYLRTAIDGRPVAVVGPDAPSDAVFPATIARAMVAIANGDAGAAGTYTLVENPAWSTREILELYATQAGVELRVTETPVARRAGGAHSMISAVSRLLAENKELLTAHLVPALPAVEARIKAWHQKRRARAEVTALAHEAVMSHMHLVGPVPGPRLDLGPVEDPIAGPAAREVRRLLEAGLGAGSHNFCDGSRRRSL